jgi:hypothetical protein
MIAPRWDYRPAEAYSAVWTGLQRKNPLGSSEEESGRFLKKAAQKLLLCWAMGVARDKAHGPA